MTEKIESRLQQAIDEHVFPGAVVGVIENDSRQFISAGRFTYDPISPEVAVETIYDVASITKAVPVALTALHFLEKNHLDLDDPIIKYIPEIDVPNADKGRIRHLLTYTYVLEKNVDPNFSYANSTAKDIFDFLFHRPFEFIPGTKHKYSNTPLNLLGIILERISQQKLHILTKNVILEPLQMKQATFHPTDKKATPPTEITDWRGEIQGEVHDETAYILERDGFDPGCAGLFSNADDLLNTAELVLGKGRFRGKQIFQEQTVDLMTTNALANINEWSGIGWELNEPFFMGAHAHPQMIGKTGFTGTSMVIDPMRQKAVVLLSNRTYPQRNTTGAINSVRSAISDIVFGTV